MDNSDDLSVQDLFNKIAINYDLLNDILSFGLHRVWKKKVLKYLHPKEGESWLDLCCGTGDMSFALAQMVGLNGRVFGIDFAVEILDIAKRRHLMTPSLPISWLNLDVLNTGLASNSFDGVVMAYGLRNIDSQFNAMIEINRLLKPGGKAAILDFNHMKEGSIGELFQKLYLRNIVVNLAAIFQVKREYDYIEKSIKRYPSGFELKGLAHQAGFVDSTYRLIGAGQMGLLLLKA